MVGNALAGEAVWRYGAQRRAKDAERWRLVSASLVLEELQYDIPLTMLTVDDIHNDDTLAALLRQLRPVNTLPPWSFNRVTLV